jgi:hypothetical protein
MKRRVGGERHNHEALLAKVEQPSRGGSHGMGADDDPSRTAN